MVEMMLDFMIGPLRQLTDIYMSHAWLCNTAVLTSYVGYRLLKPKVSTE